MQKFKLSSVFNFFENLIDPFKKKPIYYKTPPTSVIKFYTYYFLQIWKILLTLLIITLAISIIEVISLSYVGKIIDLIQVSNTIENFFRNNKNQLIIMTIVVLIIRPILFGIHDLLVQQTIIPNFATLIRWQNHKSVLQQSIKFFSNDISGKIANRVIQTGAALRDSTVQAIESVWHVFIYLISAILMFLNVDWKLILPLIIWLFLYFYLLYYFVPKIKLRSMFISETRSKLMGHIVDVYDNIGTIKLFSSVDHEADQAYKALLRHKEKQQSMNRLITIMDVSLTTINGLLIISTTALSLFLWKDNIISIGEITLVMSLIMRINNMSGWIMWTISNIFEDIGTIQDGITTISKSCEINNISNAKDINITDGKIEFCNISFSYIPSIPIISNLNLTVNPGEKIGLVGISGSGKSTIINLLLRLYDLNKGYILIDNQNIADVTQESLRDNIGVVTQNTSLLNRSIIDNLICNKKNVSFDQIEKIMDLTGIRKIIKNLLDSEKKSSGIRVGERGAKLSGGQRQLIAIARVLIKNAPILILDEATSSLDTETESIIQNNLNILMEGKTVIAIAHRLSTLTMMDRIIVLENGKIIESGKHNDLIADKYSKYSNLWNKQNYKDIIL